MAYPKSIQTLIEYLRRLPSVGPKTAERYVFYLLRQDPEYLQSLAQAIAELKEKTTVCQSCFSIAENSPCAICSDAKRDRSVICVVANTREMNALESAKSFSGLYHILDGTLNMIEGVAPDKLRVSELLRRVKNNGIKEIIIALSPNLEGETTALYLKKVIAPLGIKVSRIARGLPSGAELEYADEITLANALKFRNVY